MGRVVGLKRDIIIGLKNIWHWLPVIWRDRDWDRYYIIEILAHKLEKMAKSAKTEWYTSRGEEAAAEMEDLASALRRLQKDHYERWYLDRHAEKWGEIEMHTVPIDDEWCEVFVTRGGVIPENEEQERQEFLEAYAKARRDQEQDLKFVGEMITERLLWWWD
jgi:hypothetical protein